MAAVHRHIPYMSNLTLLRHAHAEPAIGQADHDRALDARGQEEASAVATRLQSHEPLPNCILCSSAKRTEQTARIVMDIWGMAADTLHISDALYLADPDTLLATLYAEDSSTHWMVVGHNPGLEQLLARLSGHRNISMPTACLAQLSYSGLQPTPGQCELTMTLYPGSEA